MKTNCKFLVSVNKKYSNTEAFSFVYNHDVNKNIIDINDLYTRHCVANLACNTEFIPIEFFKPNTTSCLKPEYWIDAICVD